MQHKLPPVPVRILIVLILVVGGYYAVRSLQGNGDDTLAASGSIEATTVNVSPEMAGKVKEVLAEEGQPVKTGDPLLVLDDSLLAAQRRVAQSGVDSARSALLMAQGAHDLAQAQYDAALTAARAQEGPQRLADWSKRTPNWFEQPLWYFSQNEQITAVQVEIERSSQADLRKALAADTIEIVASSRPQFRKHLASEVAKWSAVVRQAGIK